MPQHLTGYSRGLSIKYRIIKVQKSEKYNRLLKKRVTILIGSFMYIGIGAASFSYSSSILLGVHPRTKFCVIAALFLFSMYVLNYFANKEAAAFSEPSRAKLYEKHQEIFMALGIVAAILIFNFGIYC